MKGEKAVVLRQGWPNARHFVKQLRQCATVPFASSSHVSACDRSKGRGKKKRIQKKRINWLLFAATLYGAQTKVKDCSLSPPELKNHTSNWATRVSCQIGQRGGWCLLTFQDGQKRRQHCQVHVGVTLKHFQVPQPPILVFLFPPHPPFPLLTEYFPIP